MGKYLDIAKRFEARQRETFYDDGKETTPATDAWPCPHCDRPATIEDVFPSSDGERTLTMWSCEPCGVVAVTPDAIKEPPTGWVPKTRQ